jgi:uncharacterized protein (DUF362 family)
MPDCTAGVLMSSRSETIPVAFSRCPDYRSPALPETVGLLLEAMGCRPARGERVLVKPNLLAATPPQFLPCTHPQVVRAVCRYLLDLGADVRVGDSPSFGSGVKIAQKIGLDLALADLKVPIVNLDRPKTVRLSFPGGRVALSRQALESSLILNLPKLKTHRMLRVTGAVKNFFGCVPGIRKALLHVLHGDRGRRFEAMLLDLLEHLPPSLSLMDGVTAMHAGGPVHGQPYPLGLLAASPSPVALDTAVFSLLGLSPAEVPTWQEALRRRLPGACLTDLFYPLESPRSFAVNGFQVSRDLNPVGFHPLRLARSSLRHLKAMWGGRR